MTTFEGTLSVEEKEKKGKKTKEYKAIFTNAKGKPQAPAILPAARHFKEDDAAHGVAITVSLNATGQLSGVTIVGKEVVEPNKA